MTGPTRPSSPGPDIPHSIYEVEGARTCAIEFRSFSKTAGFTGTRCAYTVVPKDLVREGISLNALWDRRQRTKFNGVSYVVQRAAEAVLSPEGQEQIWAAIGRYLDNAKRLREGLLAAGLAAYGGVDAPYIWCRAPEGAGSWEFFERLLRRACVVTTPGAGFGPGGGRGMSASPHLGTRRRCGRPWRGSGAHCKKAPDSRWGARGPAESAKSAVA